MQDVVLEGENPKLILASRLEPQKAVLRFLSVVNRLVKEGSKFSVHILGDGIEKDEIKNFIDENNLSETCFLYGNQQNPFCYIRKADLFVLPSIWEAAPMVYNEAMILGVPVFTTNTISAQEMIGTKGFICENSQDGIYSELKKVLENTKLIEQKKTMLKNYCYDNTSTIAKIMSLL